jgi:hypothetical protein
LKSSREDKQRVKKEYLAKAGKEIWPGNLKGASSTF